jgi:hypothetical protein
MLLSIASVALIETYRTEKMPAKKILSVYNPFLRMKEHKFTSQILILVINVCRHCEPLAVKQSSLY